MAGIPRAEAELTGPAGSIPRMEWWVLVSIYGSARTDRDFPLIFVFQAEGGIRDTSVTGVQTCALPICPGPEHETSVRLRDRRLDHPPCPRRGPARSEERRVGKEGRSRWSPYQ